MKTRNILIAAAAMVSALGIAGLSIGAGIDDPRRADYFKTFEGKTVAFVPVTMGIDLTDGWASVLEAQAKDLGMNFVIRDPHFSADAGAQAITALISEKPDVLIVHNPDIQSYAKLLKRAEEAGIHVIQVNMRSNYNSDAYVGADWIGIGEAETQAIVDRCGAGTSQKIAILQGQPTSGSDSGMMKGAENILAKHPEIKVVANQGADWDATKARTIIATVIQQNPDLCGVVGFWDVMDLGAAAAIKESGKKIALVTSGGGEQMACDNVEKGVFDEEIAYPVLDQGHALAVMVQTVLQSGEPAGKNKFVIYTPALRITKETLHPGMCWSAASIKKN
ncbi:MAG TPA: sugar ABC transporter substrate-binding protein [Hypericibacter adhaerens]|jgi:ABC-type sugar transport system substrate-binding protein|uniref:ABC transporter substrate-binding protein n=1 Tax=Hypericibacter adhaerens TaxID=2602016 RepID=A0A5J6MRY6_9PROT|nr:sugar ABC transporter substrate-binding protein [Hypericibacter adhaerens]QEX20194.1 ABC transporter substrate-binding protein [Hypericibacter adhaerens]HWA44070.1 sugar ABC transporter substrate-binding protein [Hypericibacter adhaerens]